MRRPLHPVRAAAIFRLPSTKYSCNVLQSRRRAGGTVLAGSTALGALDRAWSARTADRWLAVALGRAVVAGRQARSRHRARSRYLVNSAFGTGRGHCIGCGHCIGAGHGHCIGAGIGTHAEAFRFASRQPAFARGRWRRPLGLGGGAAAPRSRGPGSRPAFSKAPGGGGTAPRAGARFDAGKRAGNPVLPAVRSTRARRPCSGPDPRGRDVSFP